MNSLLFLLLTLDIIYICIYIIHIITPDAMPVSVEYSLPVRKVGSSMHGRVKPITYQIYPHYFLAWRFTLL